MPDGIVALSAEALTMFFDNLTVAGLFMATPYALLPWLFRREFVRVADDDCNQLLTTRPAEAVAAAENAARAAVQAAPCR
jgi:hypothetical protein